ncbi:TraR/DksA family transcriptional regulator [Streptomyces chiangmaiensis]
MRNPSDRVGSPHAHDTVGRRPAGDHGSTHRRGGRTARGTRRRRVEDACPLRGRRPRRRRRRRTGDRARGPARRCRPRPDSAGPDRRHPPRVGAPGFGRCTACGDVIARDRLLAVPHTELCIACARAGTGARP